MGKVTRGVIVVTRVCHKLVMGLLCPYYSLVVPLLYFLTKWTLTGRYKHRVTGSVSGSGTDLSRFVPTKSKYTPFFTKNINAQASEPRDSLKMPKMYHS